MKFEKYHGLGNDYLILDPSKNEIEVTEENINKICDRNFGIGSDGILYGPIFDEDKIKVRIFNPDGSEAEKSGNGVRIFSKYLLDSGYVDGTPFILSTLGGDVKVEYLDKIGELIKVEMGRVTFISNEIPVIGESREVVNEAMIFNHKEYIVNCVSIGNPHCVILMDKVNKALAEEIGPYVENAKYFPNKINMQLLEIIDRNNIKIEIFERGAGYTLASGSSSCAATSVAYKLGLVDNAVSVNMPGGILQIEINEDGTIFMTGPVEHVCSTILDAKVLRS